MRRLIIIMSFIISDPFAFCQALESTVKEGLSNEEFKKTVAGYLDLSKTELFRNHRNDKRAWYIKMGKPFNADFLLEESTRVKWFTDNLHLTKYKTVEEAINHFQSILDMENRIASENKELFQLISRATLEQAQVIFRPMMISNEELLEIKNAE